VNQDKSANRLPNYTRRIFWVFVGQMLLTFACFSCAFFWSDFFPARLCQIMTLWALFFSPVVYLAVLAKPILHIAWRELLRDTLLFIFSAVRAFGRLFLPSTFMKLVRLVASLKPAPTTFDEWITLCVLPFKTCVIITFPMIWIFQKIMSHSSYFRPYGRAYGISYELLAECFLFSLLGLLLGALLQAIFCRSGRATVTLRFFLLGVIFIFVSMIFPQAIRI
jgi:hypothetical protein